MPRTALGPAPRRLLALTLPLVAIVAALVGLAAASMETLSAGRAYVGGEGLWSKAQKDAVAHLLRYARSFDERHYRRYLAAIAVPLGDRKAREALEAPQPDFEAARRGFIEGRNHPDDVDAMARLFVRFRHVSYVDKAIGIWAEGDRRIEQLRDAAARLRAEIGGARDPARIDALLDEIHAVDAALAPLEDAFSYTLGEATRWMRETLLYVMLGASLALLAAAALATRALLRSAYRAQAGERAALRELAALAERMEYLAHHDSLTALPNRVMLQERLREAVSLARRHRKQLALLFVDLDYFKNVNDSLGHGVGDSLLQAVAARLRAAVRQEDLVVRLGGDEFCILLQDLGDPREAAQVAGKLLTELAEPHRLGGHELHVPASIGIACLPGDGHDMETLLRHADIAMYRAKAQGRGNFQFYSPGEHRGAMSAVAMSAALRQALARREFELHYQPRVDVPSARVVAVEALLRWRHPERGLLLPEQFLALAEESGLIVPIGEWALREACAQTRRWTEAGWGRLVVAVNLSMRELRNPELLAQVRAALEGNGLPPWRLELEITETIAMHSPEHTERVVRAFSGLGVRIALDDFGTGHSALHYLKRFPVNLLKIDQSFVGGLPGDRHDAAIARAIVDLAKGLDLEIVAEGVRLPAQRDFLLGVGCRLCQGDLFGVPAPAAEIEPLLRGGLAA
ncbi:MAG: EAL domain-containing protein [Pseudomonadota bacterium]